MSGYQLAQINIGRFFKPKDDPANRDFMDALDRVNALADASPGFVWRLGAEGPDAIEIEPDPEDPQLAVNMSVWADVESLAAFAYRNPDHLAIMRRRREWFEPMAAYMALWWVPAGHQPGVEEGLAKIAELAASGPTASAFSFRQPFAAPDGTPARPILDECA